MQIKSMLIPASNKFTRPGIAINPRYITIHETSNTAKGANALAHAKLQQRGNSRQASWHYTVDDKEIYQSIPTNEASYNAGDGAGQGNMASIAIEICVNADGNFEQAKKNAAWLVRFLMDKYSIPISNVVQHNHWSGKDCPHNIRKQGWDKFISQITALASRKPSEPSNQYPGYLIREGATGKIVKEIQMKLGGLVVDGIFGVKTLARVKEFQKAHKLVADGIVGPLSWKALFG